MNPESGISNSSFKEQRRGRRYRYRLPVDIHSQSGKKRLWTHDVGSHGIFLLMKEPPRERHVLKLTVYLPEGPVGTIAHGTHTSPRGMGAQFFALSRDAKLRWDRFLAELAGEKLPTANPSDDGDGAQSATFVVKLKTTQALEEFVQHCVSAGGTYLRTPVLKEVGSSVTLTMVHPATEREFPLAGTVVRLHQKRPKGMEIHFTPGTLQQTTAFSHFIETGEPQDINVDQEVQLVLEASDGNPVAPAKPSRAVATPSMDDDVSFDIDVFDDTVVTNAALSEEEVFDWIDVDEEFLIDTGMPDATDMFSMPSTDPSMRSPGESGPIPVSQEGQAVPAALPDLADYTQPFIQVSVACNSCDMLETHLDAGGAPGVLGVVARLRPYFCPHCQMVVTRPRPLPAEERAAVREKLVASDTLNVPVPLRLLFEVAALDAPLRCPTCETKLKQTKATKALEQAITKIQNNEDPSDVEVPCSLCRDGQWTVEWVAPPLRATDQQEDGPTLDGASTDDAAGADAGSAG